MLRNYGNVGDDEDNDEENRVLEWEDGLPNAGDLTPLSQDLIPPELAFAFSIKPEPSQTILDVHRASQKTLSTLRNTISKGFLSSTTATTFTEEPMVVEGGEENDDDSPETSTKDGSETRKIRRVVLDNNTEEADSSFFTENSASCDEHSARNLKRARLVWTPQLHKRFVDVVGHLGIKNAVPKTIMQLMNVDGLTRENVASHLQKYRLYLKRMQGLSNEGPSSSDPLFASTPVPNSLHEQHPNLSTGKHIPPSPPSPPPMLPMPILAHGLGNPVDAAAYQSFEFHPYAMLRDQQTRDWSGNSRFGRMLSSYPKSSK